MTDIVNKVADTLTGTCMSLEDALEENSAEDKAGDTDFLHQLDSLVFECTTCGWWCDISEESSEDVGSDEWICGECADEEADDD